MVMYEISDYYTYDCRYMANRVVFMLCLREAQPSTLAMYRRIDVEHDKLRKPLVTWNHTIVRNMVAYRRNTYTSGRWILRL